MGAETTRLPRVRTALMPHRHVALGVRANAAPSLVFVVSGVLLGPHSSGILSANTLAQLDPVLSVALAVLGVYIGTGYATAQRTGKIAMLAGASTQAVVTLAAVAGAMFVLFARWQPPLPLDALTAALVLGLCCAASAAIGVDTARSNAALTASHLADFDDLPLVVLGAVAVPVIAGAASPLAVTLVALAGGLMIGTAGTLLFRRAQSPAERNVFVIGTVVLLGGSAAYATASPLATGCVAGLVWALPQRATTSLVESDLRRIEHPLVAILLIIAGASIELTYPLLWIAAPLVLFRLTGKLLGSLAVSHLLGLNAGLVAAMLAPPGVLGIALALNVQQVLSTGDTILVSAVTVATVVSETLAAALLPGDDLE